MRLPAALQASPRAVRLVFLRTIGYVNLFARPAFAVAFVGFPIVIRISGKPLAINHGQIRACCTRAAFTPPHTLPPFTRRCAPVLLCGRRERASAVSPPVQNDNGTHRT